MMCELWAIGNFSEGSAVWQKITQQWFIKRKLLKNDCLRQHTRTELTGCIDDVWIIGNSQFQWRKCSMTKESLKNDWLREHTRLYLPPEVMMCKLWVI